ncbi:hypothetical protein [Lacinutrix algicola]|uniref:hypothetical protein n=1 Tax=Lacinutrix algicola TaxID=342954 RepID=UPI0006E2B9F3|nr:hypothetical protein [Lacinutrix algicola]
MSKKSKPIVLSIPEMEKKRTKELLGYLKRLHKCEESFELSDLTENPDLTDESKVYFKQTEKWKTGYRNVKSILKNRENIK